jgi:hypothetical protein
VNYLLECNQFDAVALPRDQRAIALRGFDPCSFLTLGVREGR